MSAKRSCSPRYGSSSSAIEGMQAADYVKLRLMGQKVLTSKMSMLANSERKNTSADNRQNTKDIVRPDLESVMPTTKVGLKVGVFGIIVIRMVQNFGSNFG